ncbi:lipoprotein 17-related variable surface protein [Mycoplasmopsis gallinarum]|uniref:Extracellular matrix-binding protein ebh GA module domain-containing protein n=1 Tax=Mycoplasmopsis gallinarum TaxID=29557 RepID=A0A168REA7_9BACT|nr:lipoprotein 17-related variable surface protein [Mycoplasmopsis gallinarum]OAB48896.1 hypothetical protein MGALLINA_03360 [Mycoplasmopsis gallinarum]
MKNAKKIKKIVLGISATGGSLPLVFLPISQTNTIGSSEVVDSKYLSYSQYNKVQDDGIYTNYNTVEGMFFEGWMAGQKKAPIYVGTNPNYSNNESGYYKSRYYINERNNWYRLYDYNVNKAKRDRYGENSYNPAWDLLNPSLVLSSNLIDTRYNWQKNNNQDSSFFNGDGWDSVNDTKSFRVGFNVDKLRSDDRKFFVGLWISEDLILTGNIKAILSTRNSNGQFQEAIANPQNVKTYNISVDEKYNVNDTKDDRGDATWYGKEENKYRINPWISKSYDYTGVFEHGDNHSGFKFYSSNQNNEYAQFSRYYVQDKGRYTTGKTWLNSMHYGSFYKTFPKEINQNITDQYGKLWGGVANDYFRKRTIANMIIHDEPSLKDVKYKPVLKGENAGPIGLYQKQYKDNNNYIYNSLNNNAGSLLILEIKSEDESTAGFTPSLQLEFTVKRNPNTIDNNGVRSGNNSNPLSRDASSKKTYIGFGQFKYESSGWADRQFGSFMKMADRQAYQNIKFNTTEKLVKSEYLLDNDKLPNTTLSLIQDNNGTERLIHSVNKSKYNEAINQDKILAEYKTKNNVDSLTQYSNINNLRLKTSFVNPEDYKKWKIVSENSYSTQNPNIFSFNTSDDDGYLNFNDISYDLTDYEKLKRFANDRTKNKWLTIKQIKHLLDQIEQNENFNKTTYSFNDPKWFEYFKEEISNLNKLQGQAEAKRAELRNLVVSTTDKTDWNSEISNKVLFAFADQREAKGQALKLLEIEGWSRNTSTAKKYDLQSELNLNREAVDRNIDSKVTLQTAAEVTKYISDVNDVITKIKQTGKNNLENEFIDTLNSQSITNKNWSNYNYIQGTKFIIDAINSVLSRYNTPYDITTFVPANNTQYQSNKNTILNKIKALSTLYDEIQKIQPIIENIKNDKLVYGKTSSKPTIDNVWYNNFVTKLQNNNNVSNDSSYAFYSQGNLDTFKTQNASNLKNNWIDKILELNGNKTQFTSDINSFNYLDESAKNSFLQKIPNDKNFTYNEASHQLSDNRTTINNQLTSLINEAFNQAKIKAKEKINGFAYVSQALKNAALTNIDNAELYKNKTDNAQDDWVYFGNDKNLKTIVDELEKQNNYHKQLIDYLNSPTLNNNENNVLTQKQKEAFKNDILSKNFADENAVNEYKESINNVNDATQKLKTYVTNLNTNTDKYNFASPDKKGNFDVYKAAADSLLNNQKANINPTAISKLQENLTNAYNALDGDILINKVKQLEYFTTDLQNLVINQIKAADASKRQEIYEKAKTLNDNFGANDLSLITTYNSANSTTDYTNGSKGRKSAFDSALTNLNAKLNTSKNKLEQPTTAPTDYTNFIENYISQYNQLKSAATSAYDNLDGDEITAEKARLNAINLTFDYPSKKTTLPSKITESSITNNLSQNNVDVIKNDINKNDTDGTVGFNYQLVSTDSKFNYLPADEKIKSDPKSATINGFLTSVQKAINDKKAELIEKINQAKDTNKITDSQKQTLIDAVNNATNLDELNKQEAKDNEIFKLTSTYQHLNPKQNQELFEKIQNATSIEEAKTIFAKKENVDLNNSMKKLKDFVTEYKSKKSSVDYTSATNQSQFDTILNSATDLISSTTNNGSTNPSLNTLIEDINQSGSLTNSFALLDGIKNKAKNDINDLSYLTETQKQQYKSEIDKISDLQTSETKQAEVDKILTKAKLNQYNATFDYDNKSKITPSQIVESNVNKTIVYNNSLGSPKITTDQIEIKQIVKNDADGTATVKYVIKDANDQSLTSDTKEAIIRGFKTGDQAEKERLDEINSVTVKATAEQKQNQASKLTNAQDLQWDIQSSQNAEIVDKNIVGYNDITGKLKVSYRLKSKTSTNIYSDVKYAEIEGFQTEKQRLDALLTQANAILTITNKKVPSESTYGTDFNIAFKDSNVQKASFKEIPNITNKDDRNGQITFDYTLKSDRQDLITIQEEATQATEVVSAKSSSFTASGFLTEKERLEDLFKNVISLSYNEPNKANSTINPSELQTKYLSIANANNYKINPQYELLNLTSDNYRNGTRSVKVTLNSTKDGLTDISYTYDLASLLTKKTLSTEEQKIVNRYTLSGFETEQTRINNLAVNFVPSKTLKMASDLLANKNNWQTYLPVNPQLQDATLALDEANGAAIVANDKTGELTLKYKVISSRVNGISSNRTYHLNNLMTESDRLNAIINDSNIAKTIQEIQNKTNVLPSSIQNVTFNDLDAKQKAIFSDIELRPNDATGQLVINYKLQSTRDNLKDQKSSTTGSVTIDDFLTTLDKAKRDAKEYINNSQNLSNDEKTKFNNLIDQQNSVTDVNNKLLEAQKQELINQIDQTYAYLNPKQKENLKALINSATSKEDAQTKFNSYSDLNTKMNKLSDLVTKYANTTTSDAKYTNATESAKNNFKTAYEAAKTLLTSTTDEGASKLDQYIANRNAPNSLDNLYDALDGLQNNAINEINGLPYLNKNEKTALINKIKQVPNNSDNKESLINTIVEQATNANKAKKPYIEAIQGLSDLSEKEKTNFKNQIINNAIINNNGETTNQSNTQNSILKEAKKQNWSNQIDKLTSINSQQKQAFKDQLSTNKSDSENEKVVTNAKAYDALDKQAKGFNQTFNKNQPKYIFAQDNLKTALDNALDSFTPLINTNATNIDLNELQTKLNNFKQAVTNLDGEKQLQDLKDKIDTFTSLSENQRETLKNQVSQRNNLTEAKKLVANAENLNSKLTDLNNLISTLEAEKTTNSRYINEDATEKSKYDQAIISAKNEINDSLKQNFADTDITEQINDKITQISTLTSSLNQAKDALDGDRKEFKRNLNNFDLWKDNQKDDFIQKVNELPKDFLTTQSTKKAEILNNAFTKMQENARDKVNNSTLSQDDKNTLLTKINSAQIDTNTPGKSYDWKLVEILKELNQNNQQKLEAKKKIQALTNLNKAQKDTWLAKIDAADLNNLDEVVTNATNLDTAMATYKKTPSNLSEIKQGIDYTEASNQSTLDNLITQRDNANNYEQGNNLSLEEVNNAITAINNAVNALDGVERVEAAKTKAKNNINTNYTSLTQNQKDLAIKKIDALNSVSAIESQDQVNSALNNSMKALRAEIPKENAVKQSEDYIYETNSNQNSYDNALSAAKDLLNTLETSQNETNLFNKSDIDTKTTNLSNVQLNGSQRKADELARLTALDSQPSLKNGVNQSKTASQVLTSDIEFKTLTDANATVSSITNTNEETGAVALSYQLISTKENLESLTVDKSATLTTLSEKQRLNQLIDNDQVTKTITYPDSQNVIRSEINEDNFVTQIAQEAQAKIVIDSFNNNPNNPKAIDITYHLVSTKNGVNAISKTKTLTLDGFQSDVEREQNTINTYTESDYTFTADSTKLASYFKDNASQIQISPKTTTNRENETIEIQRVVAYNDVDGTLKVEFVTKSNKNGTLLTSNTKVATISGYKTESQRLDDLLNNLSQNNINVGKDKATTLPSDATITADYTYSLSGTEKATLNIIDAISPNNELGKVTFTAKLVSTKAKNELVYDAENSNLPAITTPETSITKSLEITGFRTQTEQDELDKQTEVERLNNLSASFDYTDKTTTLPSEANKNQITSTFISQNPEATIVIKNISAYDEITGAITFKYAFASAKDGIYSGVESTEKTATLTGFKTEKMRLDELLRTNKDQLEAQINNLATNAYKDNLASNVIDNFVITDKNNSLDNARINILTKVPDDVSGRISYTYNLVSTKTLNNNQDLSGQNSESISGTLGGFKTNADVESERLNNTQTYSVDYADKTTTLASSLKDDAITNWTWNKPNDADYEFIDRKVIAYDDVNGKIKVEFKLKSTKNNLGKEVISNKKVVELSGFLTEKQRLDNLIQTTQTSSVITNDQNALVKKPSQLTNDDFTITKPQAWTNENANIVLVIDDQDRDDENGTIKTSYQLSTTRTNLISGYENVNQNVVSDNAPKATFNNYLTTNQEEINRLDAISPTYSNLNNKLLPSQITTNNSNSTFSINLPQDAEAEVINLVIESQNDKDGSLTISYQLQSTKTNLNTLASAKKSYTFSKANNDQYFTEKERLDLLAYNPTLSETIRTTKTASEIKAKDIEFATVDNATVLVSDIQIIAVNEVTGEVQITYLATSQRANLTNVKSSLKNATLNTLTELQRLNNLVTASEEVFNFAGNQAQNLTTVDEVTLEQLSGYLAQEIDNQKTNILSQNQAKLVIDSIASTNSATGEIVLNWHLESTKTNLNNQVVKTANKQYTLTGFQTANEREQQELNALENTDFTFTYDRTKLASEFKTNPSGISIQSNRSDTTAESAKVIAYNDITGELVLEYVAKSTKNGTDFTSETKTVTLNGFKNEQQRLDQLADNLSNTSLIFNNDNSTRVNYLPSNTTATTQNNYAYANSANDQASLNAITFSPNDETGSSTSQITLRSDKLKSDLIWAEDNLKYNDYQYSTITSKNKELTLTGFRTQNEQNNLDQAAERARLNDLSATFDYTDKTNVLPSNSVKDEVTSQIDQVDNQATVKIIQISTKDEINGQITGKYVFVSNKEGIYSNLESEEKEFTITGFKTESQRLNDLLSTIEAQAAIQNVNASEYKNHLPADVLDQLILSANNLTNAQIEIVNKNANSADAAIDYVYRLVSTRGLVNGQNLNTVTSTTTKNGKLGGFKTLVEAEKERLDAIDVNNNDDQFSHTIDYAAKNLQLASSLTQATGQNWNWKVNPDSDHEFVDQQIVGYNDITGELKVSYKLQSKKSGFETVQSETKYAVISGFKTEKQRLDDLVNNTQNQPVTISQNANTLKDGANAKKASDLATSDFTTTLTSAGENQNIKVYLELDTKNADNEHGTILVGYQLESTRNLTGDNGLVSENWENKPAEKPLIKSEKSRTQEFSGYVTNDDEEANRIEKLLPLLKLDYPDKANYLPLLNEDEVLSQNVEVKFKDGRALSEEQVALKPNSLTIVKRDDEKGLIQVQYTLVSTTRNSIERVVNATAQEDAKQLTGFKTELQRLQALNYVWENQITNKNSISPSDLEETNINAIENTLDQATNIQITSRNDKTGVISGTYSIYSKRPNLETIHIDNLNFTINGLQTEEQRLDRVIADRNIAKSITYNKNDQNTTKASALVANKAEVIKNLNNSYFVTSVANNEVNKAQIVIDDISANDETGNLTVTYHLASLKDGLKDQRSSASQTLEIGGFLTNLQDAKNKAKAYIDQLVTDNKLTTDQAEELKTEIDNATNDDEITEVKTKADKQVIINDALNNFTNSNQAQKDKLIEEITNSSDINEAQKIKEKYSDLNDKMGDLADLVTEYKKKKAEEKYTQASKNTKDAFDDVIAKAEKLLDKTNATDLGTNIDEFLGTKEDHSDGSINQKYEALDGEIQKVIKQVEASDLLSDDQKTSFKEEINKVSPKDLSYTEDNKVKTLDQIKADILDKEQEKQRYINAINTFENLNQQQKDDYIAKIKAANSADLETINEEARLLDNEMAKLKEAASDQDEIKASDKYLQAYDAIKNTYDNTITSVNKVINGRPADASTSDNFPYNANKDKVTRLINDLNWIELQIEKDAAKRAINNLENLNQDEKDKAIDLIADADSKEKVNAIVAVEKVRNNQKQPYIDQIQTIPNLSDSEQKIYINEIKNTNLNLSPDNVVENAADFEAIILKAQKDSLIKELEKSVNNDETARILNPKQLEYFKNEINNATNLKEAQSALTSALEIADKMANLKEKVAKYTALINDSNNTKYQNADNQELIQNKLKTANELLNSTTQNGLDRDNDNLDNLVANNKNDQSLDYAYDILNGKENILKEKVNNSDLLSTEEKTSLNEQINKVDKLNNEDEQVAEITKVIADKEKAKQDAIEQINNLDHLNQSQKDSLINEIKSSSAEDKDNVVNKAKELDKTMEGLQEEVKHSDEVHQSTAYQNATDEQKNNYDNALENANQVLNNQKPNDYASSNLNQNEVVELINKLREIESKLEGNKNKLIADNQAKLHDLINKYDKELKPQTKKAIQEILDELKEYGVDTESIQNVVKLIEKTSKLQWLLEQYQNSKDINNTNTQKAKEDLINHLAEVQNDLQNFVNTEENTLLHELINQIYKVKSDFVTYSSIKVKITDAITNYDLELLADLALNLNKLNDYRYINLVKNLNQLEAINDKNNYEKVAQTWRNIIKNNAKLDVIDKDILNKKAMQDLAIKENLNWIWYLFLSLGLISLIGIIATLANRKK